MEVKIIVIPKEQQRSMLERWEREDSYYSGMSKSFAGDLNKKARKYPYVGASETEVSSMIVKTDVPINGPINIVYLDGRSDAGFPHTRGMNGIALPIFLLWHPSEKTIQHELVHLSQKQYSERWWAWYKRVWNFRLATEKELLSISEKWRRRRRINPDTLGIQYAVWRDRYIPLNVFISEDSPDIRYCKRGFWDLQMTQWTWDAPPGWETTFGRGFNDEHPNEIAAHWIDGSAGKEKQQYFHLDQV